jgi:hypothetical protein
LHVLPLQLLPSGRSCESLTLPRKISRSLSDLQLDRSQAGCCMMTSRPESQDHLARVLQRHSRRLSSAQPATHRAMAASTHSNLNHHRRAAALVLLLAAAASRGHTAAAQQGPKKTRVDQAAKRRRACALLAHPSAARRSRAVSSNTPARGAQLEPISSTCR